MNIEEFDLRSYVRERYDKHNVTNSAEITSCIYTKGVDGIRYFELYSKVKDELKRYTSELGLKRKEEGL